MEVFIGTKTINACLMTLGDYNTLRGWEIPSDQEALTEGYLVEYTDSGKPNHPEFAGYISWSPKDVFEDAYKMSGELSFGHALEAIKQGYRLARKGWNGANMFVFLVDGSTFVVNREPLKSIFPEGTEVNYRPHIDLAAADETVGVWQPSMGDVMADDWYIEESATSVSTFRA